MSHCFFVVVFEVTRHLPTLSPTLYVYVREPLPDPSTVVFMCEQREPAKGKRRASTPTYHLQTRPKCREIIAEVNINNENGDV